MTVSQPTSADRSVATRRRGAALETALLDAAWAELQDVGYPRLTMEGVADRAGTSRAVIYRRWSSRHELVIAALGHQQPIGRGRIPDTGSLREDLLTVMRRAARRISDIGPSTVTGLLNDLIADDAPHAIIDQLARGGGEVIQQILAQAAARGEARENVPERVARLPLDLIRHELILNHRAPSNDTLEEIIDEIFLPLVEPAARTPTGRPVRAKPRRATAGQSL